ncbi:MAG: isocitrate lyase/phosphoenolpyruvate mutase family protein [Pacificimonas sp.]
MSTFHELHVPGEPLVLFNVWDAGSAQAVVEAGAKAVATGSASVARAHGFDDGQDLPLALALANAKRIVRAVDCPVSIDFEGGYADSVAELDDTIRALAETGAAGLNFEDGYPGTGTVRSVEDQVDRLRAVRAAGPKLFVNARTDVFLNAHPETHGDHMEDAQSRLSAYVEAGADGLFVPGLRDLDLIARICETFNRPVNVMWLPDMASNADLAGVGVARISHGPFPHMAAMAALTEAARAAL